MSFDEFDIGGAAQAAPDSSMIRLNQLLEEATKLEEAVNSLEEDLKAAKKALQSLKTGRIPDLMAEIGLDSVGYQGWKVTVGDFVSGSLPSDPDRRQKALEWLEANEAAGIIKTEVRVQFEREMRAEAVALSEELRDEGFVPIVDSSVHSQTLQAFARERIRNGEPIDTEVLGLYTGKIAKFSKG